MGFPCFIKCCSIGLRFLRYKFYPWITLAIAPFSLLFTSDGNRIQARIRYMRAMSKIDFAGVYGLLNDLLW